MTTKKTKTDPGLDAFLAFVAWCRAPKLTGTAVGYILLITYVFAWFITGDWLKAWALLFTLAGLALAYKVGSWFIKRKRYIAEQGIKVPWHRMVRDFLTEKKQFDKTRARWELFVTGQKITWNDKTPNLTAMMLDTSGQVRAQVNPAAIGGDLETIAAAATSKMPGIMNAREVKVEPIGNTGRAWLTFVTGKDPLARPLSVLNMPLSGPDRISFGIEETGGVAAFALGYNLLIGGASNAGKSSFAWAAFFDLVRDGTHAEVWIVDPKRLELCVFEDLVGEQIGNVKIMGYMRTTAEVEELCKGLRTEMHDRQDRLKAMAGFSRKLDRPTEDFPARMVWIDEALDVADAWKKGTTSDMGIIMSQGRATKDFFMMSTQVGQLSEIGSIRKMFQLRVCFRMGAPEDTKAILGVDESKGVACSQIPFGQPGVGYYVTDSGVKMKFRAAFASDDHIEHLITERQLPTRMMTRDLAEELGAAGERPCYVYFAPDKVTGDLVYVGKANEPRVRFKQHRTAKKGTADWKYCDEHGRVENFWVEHVDEANIHIKMYPSEKAALVAESREIEMALPRFNVVGNVENPRANHTGGTVVRPRPKPRVAPRVKPVLELVADVEDAPETITLVRRTSQHKPRPRSTFEATARKKEQAS